MCVASGQDPDDPTADLDPDIESCNDTFVFFRTCKTNCRGGTWALGITSEKSPRRDYLESLPKENLFGAGALCL